MNYTALSPITSTAKSPWTRTPVSLSSLSRPAGTVAFASRHTDEEAGGYWYGSGALLLDNFTIEAPDCYDIAPVCADNWGAGSYEQVVLRANRVAGAWNGGSQLRKSGLSILEFADGHVKAMDPGQAAAGTNWNPNIADSALKMVNSANYLWGNF